MENKLKSTKKIVKEVLEKDEKSRNSDSYLYLKVLSVVANQKNVNLDSISVPFFLMNLQGKEFPPFESVRRTRQKIQAEYPELSACDRVEGFRAENEREYRGFARSGA